jgi:hypothetical protein
MAPRVPGQPDARARGRAGDRARAHSGAPRFPRRAAAADQAEQLALVVRAKRELLLRAHRHRLRQEDLEDCFSQALVELLRAVRDGQRFAGHVHAARALEQRFLSRVHDRRRAARGRSPLQTALERALPLGNAGELDIRDRRADVHEQVARRCELEELLDRARDLSADQRLVLASQTAQLSRGEFCERHGWSFEKYRKVAQRGRARLRAGLALEPVPPRGRRSE